MKNDLNKTVLVETIVDDGKVLRGEITYWAKDYSVCLKEPFEVECGGPHMMYAVPARYVTTETPIEGVKDINIVPIAKEKLQSLYRWGMKYPEGYQTDPKLLEALEELESKKRELKKKLKSDLIDHKSYQKLFGPMQKAKSELEQIIEQAKEPKC